MSAKSGTRFHKSRPLTRSETMSRIRSRNTKPEMLLRRAVWRKGGRYRLHYPLPGSPDMAFVRARVAIFVDGCFWHCCPLHCSMPSSSPEYWSKKLRRNQARDRETNERLRELGWHVVRVWEHEVKWNAEDQASTILEQVHGAIMRRQPLR